MEKKFIAEYLRAPKTEEEKGAWVFAEKKRKFQTLKEAIEISKKIMKKNKEIIQVAISKLEVRKIFYEGEMAVVLWNEDYVIEESESGITIEYQSKEYEKEAKK